MSTEFLRGISLETPEIPEPLPLLKNWDFLEISGDALGSAEVLRKLRKCPARLLIRDLCTAELAQSLPEAALSVQRDFLRMFRDRCAWAAEQGAGGISIAFDLVRAMGAAEYERNLRHFLSGCYGILEEYHLSLRLPLRIPGAEPQKFLALMHRMLYPGIRILPDFHPHEPGAFEQLSAAARILRFERSFWRITYNSALGNYLAPELMRRFFAALALPPGEMVCILFAPGKSCLTPSLMESLEKLGKSVDF